MIAKKGILLVNLGTPNSPTVSDVRKYLREFLLDARVIDIGAVARWLLVNLIIVPFRGPKSAKEYQKLWTDRGSPLKYYGEDVAALLQEQLGKEYLVVLGMRYQQPSIESALKELKKSGISSIKVIPLFPQYASATTGSVMEEVMRIVRPWQVIPQMEYVAQFYKHPLFIDTIVQRAKSVMKNQPHEHFVFSYHGLPERQIYKAGISACQLGNCCSTCGSENQYCYRAQCFATTELIAQQLELNKENYTTAFQSRLGKDPWIQPYTEDLVQELAKKGIKRVLAFSPAFVADCLETTLEVGETYKEEFIEAGGETWDLVESLNTHPTWIKCLKDLSQNSLSH